MNVLILMLSDSPGIGGMEKHARELSAGLAAKELRVTLAGSQQHLQNLSSDVGAITINTTGSRHSPVLLLRILRLIRSGHFDVVHAQGTKAAFVLQRLSPLIRACRLIATIHGFKSRYPKANAFDRMIAVSKTLTESIGQPGVSVVYNGVGLPTARPVQVPKTEPPVWLAAGRLVPVKGFRKLIDAFQHCQGSLLIAGEGPEREALQQLIDATGQQNRIHLLGHRNDLPSLMSSTDGVIISSEREGFSYVCAEALLLGKPVISTNVPIANELLPPQHLVDLTNPEALATCLRTPTAELLADQNDARAIAVRDLTLNAMVENTLNIYREVMHCEQ